MANERLRKRHFRNSGNDGKNRHPERNNPKVGLRQKACENDRTRECQYVCDHRGARKPHASRHHSTDNVRQARLLWLSQAEQVVPEVFANDIAKGEFCPSPSAPSSLSRSKALTEVPPNRLLGPF